MSIFPLLLLKLWWGWIGFNCGSTFGITGDRWIVASRAAIITINCTAGGGIAAIIYTQWKTRGTQIRPHHLVNGILGSLVASSPVCASVQTWDALIIGAIGSVIANLGNTFIKRCRLDDPVGAVGVHAFAAVWGLLAVGLFADENLPGTDLINTGLFSRRWLQTAWPAGTGDSCYFGLGVLYCRIFLFYIAGVIGSRNGRNPRLGLRVSLKEEIEGEDRLLHGVNQIYDNKSMRFGKISLDGDDDDSEDEEIVGGGGIMGISTQQPDVVAGRRTPDAQV